MDTAAAPDMKLRTVRWYLQLVAGLLAFLILLSAVSGIIRHVWNLEPILLFVAFFGGLLVWYWAVTIEIKDGVLIYTTLIWKRAIPLNEIAEAWIETRPGHRGGPRRYLYVRRVGAAAGRPFSTLLNNFDRREVRRLCTLLNATHRRRKNSGWLGLW